MIDALSRTTMESHIRKNLGSRTDLASDTRVTDWLNWALEDTASIRNWRDMIEWDKTTHKTAEDRYEYPLGKRVKDVLVVKYMDDANSVTLTWVTPENYHRKWPHPPSYGNALPNWYTVDADTMLIYPPPSDVNKPLHLRVALWPFRFNSSASGDEVCPLSRLESALIAQATAYAYGAIKEWDQKRIWHNDWWKAVKRAARKDRAGSTWTLHYASNRVRTLHRSGVLRLILPSVDSITRAS